MKIWNSFVSRLAAMLRRRRQQKETLTMPTFTTDPLFGPALDHFAAAVRLADRATTAPDPIAFETARQSLATARDTGTTIAEAICAHRIALRYLPGDAGRHLHAPKTYAHFEGLVAGWQAG